jgi:hypothetical protein
MGAFDETVMRQLVNAMEASMAALGVRDCRPARARAAAE